MGGWESADLAAFFVWQAQKKRKAERPASEGGPYKGKRQRQRSAMRERRLVTSENPEKAEG